MTPADSPKPLSLNPCGDRDLNRLCFRYSKMLPCCDTVTAEGAGFAEGNKLPRDKANCADLFGLLKEELLKINQFEFKVASWCMFPVLKKGDLLKIEPVPLGDIRIGDIPVYRSNNILYSHRIVDKQIIGRKSYIITRPDTSKGLGGSKNTERVPEKEILGIIKEVKRAGRTFSTEKRSPWGWEIFLLKRAMFCSTAIDFFKNFFIRLQTYKSYEILGRMLTAGIRPYLDFELALPFSNSMLKEVCNYTPFKDNEKMDFSKLKKARLFHLVMKFNNVTIGHASFLNRPDSCPYQGLRIGDIYIRLRYARLGFESILLKKAEGLSQGCFLREDYLPLKERP